MKMLFLAKYISIYSRQNPLHLSSCYCFGYRFWGRPIAFQGFVEISIFEIQHEAKIHSQTGLEMDRAVVLLVSGASATLHVPFVLHAFACMFLHFPFIYSVHVHSNVHSCPFIFLSFACRFLSFCIHVLSTNGYH